MLPGFTPWPEAFAERYRGEGLWRGDNLADLLHHWAARSGTATALVHRTTRMSYQDLADQVERTAAGFAAHGVRAGDRLVLQLPNTPDFVVTAFALFRLGALPEFCLTSHRAVEVRHLCELSGAAGYITPASHRGFHHAALARQLLEDLPELQQVFLAASDNPAIDPVTVSAGHPWMVPLTAVEADPQPTPTPVDPATPAFFLLSGGTTALPKLIPRTHDDYAYQVRAAADVLQLGDDSVYLAALPVEFNFTWGCPGVLGTLASGGTVVLADDPSPSTCFPLIAAEGVTFTSLVPTIARLWVDAAADHGTDLTSLQAVQIGGAKLAPELAAQIGPALDAQLLQVFGMAEGLLTMSRPDDDPHTVLHTQGRPLSPADEIRIVDPADQDLPAEQVGELLARGPYTLRGYYRAAEHNRRAFTDDGFYRTGDLAQLTADGHLVVEGRLKDVIIRGGDKISAPEVEGHLAAQPDVIAAAVVAAPDDFLGERSYAFLLCRPGSTPPGLPQLKQALRRRGLADFKLPDRLEVVAAFPLTPLGKVDKKALAAAAADPSAARPWASSSTAPHQTAS